MENVSILTATYDNINDMSGITKKIRDAGFSIKDYIKTESIGIYDGHPDNTLLDNNIVFSSSAKDPYIKYQFIGRKMYLKSYSIMSVVGEKAAEHHPRHWIIQGSNNNQTWTMIDIQHTNVFDCKGKTSVFHCKRPGAFSFIKMKQTGPNFLGNSDFLRFNQFEFFGTLFPSQYDFYPIHRYVTRCITSRNHSFSLFLLIFIS